MWVRPVRSHRLRRRRDLTGLDLHPNVESHVKEYALRQTVSCRLLPMMGQAVYSVRSEYAVIIYPIFAIINAFSCITLKFRVT